MSARIAGYILILQSEKNHDSVERLNLADRITEVEKANNLYLDLDTQRGIVKEQKGLSATSLHKNCNGLLNQLYSLVNDMFFYYDNELFIAFADELNAVAESYQWLSITVRQMPSVKKNERKGLKLLPVINN